MDPIVPEAIHHNAGDTADPANSAELVAQAECFAREMRIPPCPEVLTRFAAEMRAPEPDLRKLSVLIGSDVALSASLLKTVNSLFYGLSSRATSVRQAVLILGLRASANLISGLLLREAFAVRSGALMQRFWANSSALAQSTLLLASRLKGVAPDEAHTYMLFRDCGIAAMIEYFPDYGDILDAFLRNPSARVTALELARYRYHHARVGYSLTRSWLLPEPFCLAILHHHEYDRLDDGLPQIEVANRRLIAFGLLADQVLALRNGDGLCPDWVPQERFVLDTLEISPDDIVALVDAGDPVASHYPESVAAMAG